VSFKSFLKDKMLTIVLLLFAVITIEIFLIQYPIVVFIKWYIPIIIVSMYTITLMIEYFTKKSFYSNLKQMLEELEAKYLITEMIKTPNFIEGKLLKELLEETNKSMIENVNTYKYMRRRLQRIYRIMDS